MAKQSSVNLDITNNSDGFDISGGTTSRKLTIAGADMTFTGSGTALIKLPTVTTNLSGTSIVFTPLDNQPPAANYATVDTRNSILVLDFDAATDEAAIFVGIVPPGMVLTSGITVRIVWMATSATSGTCRWGIQIERMNTDADSDSYDTTQTGGTATNGTSGIPSTTSIVLTTIDSIASGDPFRLKVYRDADQTSGSDDMVGDAELIAVEIRSS